MPLRLTAESYGIRGLRVLYTTALFLAAFLLFCSQPMVGKMMLPLLGGSAAVWTTAVLFFQVALLAGYIYADRLSRLRDQRIQALVHLLLMGVAFFFLPIRFAGEGSDAVGLQNPVLWELLRLTRTVGVPYLMISTTAPLVQRWFSGSQDPAARDPYFLYAVSNAGSLLGLLAYPFIIEPRLGVRAQNVWWTWGYAGLVLFVLLAALTVRRASRHPSEEVAPSTPLVWKTCLYWMAAAFVPSGLFLAVTTHISVNLTMPLIWTIPLAIYLLTFILAFGRRIRISSATLAGAVPPLLVLFCPAVGLRVPVEFSVDVFLMAVHMVLLFLAALLCHTALADARPDTTYLTRYYVWIALGGALGGVFAAIVAPVLFNTILEYPLLLAAAMLFRKPARGNRWLPATGLAALVLGYAFFLPGYLAEPGTTIHVARNFFGVKKVMDIDGKTRKLLHGDTMHGLESLEQGLAGQPVAYYHPDGPLGDAMRMLGGRPNQHVAVVGLGAGSIAAYASPERRVTFFEIDPQVEIIARRFFTFLERCGKNCDVHLGDGRLLMTRFPEQEFDLIVLDAFSSDAIPPHLLSREAMEVYLSRLKPGGAVLFHVSNRYLKVKELVSTLLTDMNLPAYLRVDGAEDKPLKNRSVYVITADLPPPSLWRPVTPTPGLRSWSDDYSNLIDLVKWGTESD
jgi:SAM-dependent methyltransferase